MGCRHPRDRGLVGQNEASTAVGGRVGESDGQVQVVVSSDSSVYIFRLRVEVVFLETRPMRFPFSSPLRESLTKINKLVFRGDSSHIYGDELYFSHGGRHGRGRGGSLGALILTGACRAGAAGHLVQKTCKTYARGIPRGLRGESPSSPPGSHSRTPPELSSRSSPGSLPRLGGHRAASLPPKTPIRPSACSPVRGAHPTPGAALRTTPRHSKSGGPDPMCHPQTPHPKYGRDMEKPGRGGGVRSTWASIGPSCRLRAPCRGTSPRRTRRGR